MTPSGAGGPKLSELAARVLAAVDVVALASELHPLRREGRELMGRCPFHEDRHPSFSMNASSGKFFCFGCLAKGDLFDLVGRVWGVVGLRGQLVAVAQWGNLGWALDRLAPRGDAPAGPMPKQLRKLAPHRRLKSLPDRNEVFGLWKSCAPVTDDPEVADFLARKGIDARNVAERDLARALPRRSALPWWAAHLRTPWNHSRHRLVAGLFNEKGRLSSLTVRRVAEDSDERSPKALFPPGSRRGLLLADDAGRWALRAPHDYMPSELWIAEGLTDHLALACDFSLSDASSPGVLSVVGPGSWSQACADRVPDHVVIVIAVDADEAGERYAAEIARTFSRRPVRIDRWRPAQGQERT